VPSLLHQISKLIRARVWCVGVIINPNVKTKDTNGWALGNDLEQTPPGSVTDLEIFLRLQAMGSPPQKATQLPERLPINDSLGDHLKYWNQVSVMTEFGTILIDRL
jgi:hypothetical protein